MDSSGRENANSSSSRRPSADIDDPSGGQIQLPSTAITVRPPVKLSTVGSVTTQVSNTVHNLPPSTGVPGPQIAQLAKNGTAQVRQQAQTTSSGRVQNLRIIQGPHGEIEVQGLLPGPNMTQRLFFRQQILRLPDGRLQLLSMPGAQGKGQVKQQQLQPPVRVGQPGALHESHRQQKGTASNAPTIPSGQGQKLCTIQGLDGKAQAQSLLAGQRFVRLPDGQVRLLTMPGAQAKVQVKQQQLHPPVRTGQPPDVVVSKAVHKPKQIQLEKSQIQPQAQDIDVEQPPARPTPMAIPAATLTAASDAPTIMVSSSLIGATQVAEGTATAQVQIPVSSIAGKPAPAPAVTPTSPSRQLLSPGTQNNNSSVPTQVVQQDLTPLSKTDRASTLKRKYFSMSQPSNDAKLSSAQKAPKASFATNVIKSPKRKHKGERTKQSTLLPFLRKMAPSCSNTSSNTSHEAASPPGPFGRNKMTSETVDPLKDHKINGPSTPVLSYVNDFLSTTSHEKQKASPLSRESAMTKENVDPLKDDSGAPNHSSTTVMEEAVYYQTPLHSEKHCESLTTPRRKLFGECQGTQARSPKGALPVKKDNANLDYLPGLDKICDSPQRKSNLTSSKQEKVAPTVQCKTSESSDLDSVLVKAEPSTDEPLKQSRNLSKLTEDQYMRLRDTFAENPYPSMAQLIQLAEDFGTIVSKVQIYFGGRRKTLRRKMMRQGIPITSRQEMCLYAQEPKRPAWNKLLLKQDEAKDKDYHIGQEASGGNYISILCDIGLDYVKSY